MPHTTSLIALRDQLAVALGNGTLRASINEPTLRQRVCAVVDDLKDGGWPAERIIVLVKGIAADAGLSASHGIIDADSTCDDDAIIASMVQWCIAHYYGDVDAVK
jgi:hypothetical protein